VPGIHGRFQLAAAQGPRLPRPANEDNGVVVVGSFPAGASRDGVMDLAGNVGEWCSDFYTYPLAGESATDPCHQVPGNYRSIRGGSWGWYGNSQRASDREFNSQNYPGHAFYGLRIVLPEAGWKKLGGRSAELRTDGVDHPRDVLEKFHAIAVENRTAPAVATCHHNEAAQGGGAPRVSTEYCYSHRGLV
jgi:hypothetical protein